jgi:hypothetical protein
MQGSLTLLRNQRRGQFCSHPLQLLTIAEAEFPTRGDVHFLTLPALDGYDPNGVPVVRLDGGPHRRRRSERPV